MTLEFSLQTQTESGIIVWLDTNYLLVMAFTSESTYINCLITVLFE